MKLVAPIISLAAIASGRFTKRAALDNLGSISFGDDGLTFNLAEGTITIKRENGKFKFHSKSNNGDSYSRMSFDKNSKRWEAEIDWDKNDLPDHMYKFHTETMDFTSKNKCKWNTLVWSEWFECNDNGCEGKGSGSVDGAAMSATSNINWSCNDDSKNFNMVFNFDRPNGVCTDNEHMNGWAGETSLNWSATKNDDGWSSKLAAKGNDFNLNGGGRFTENKVTAAFNAGGDMKGRMSIEAINGNFKEAQFYKVAMTVMGQKVSARLPGRKQVDAIREAIKEQYGWMKQVADLIKEAPIKNGARFLLWSDQATDIFENEFDCTSVVEATGIQTNFLGMNLVNDVKDGCATFNTKAVAYIQERADEKAPSAREEVGFMLDLDHAYNVNLKNQWIAIFA